MQLTNLQELAKLKILKVRLRLRLKEIDIAIKEFKSFANGNHAHIVKGLDEGGHKDLVHLLTLNLKDTLEKKNHLYSSLPRICRYQHDS